MSRKDMQRANLELRISHPEGNWDSHVPVEVTLYDRMSNKTVAVLELTLRDYHNLMSGRRVGDNEGVSYLAKPSDLAKLRRTRVAIYRALPKLPYREDGEERLQRWAEDAARAMGTDEARVSKSNTGAVTVSLLFYINPADQQDVEEFQQRHTEQLAKLSLRSLGVED